MDKKTVLFVEDDSSQRAVLVEACVRAGLVVSEAVDGDVGLQKALAEHPDLILLDILMPKKDGMQFLAELRNDAWGKTAKVIILSNVSGTEQIAEAMTHEAFDYLVKSDMGIDAVVATIKSHLGLGGEKKEG